MFFYLKIDGIAVPLIDLFKARLPRLNGKVAAFTHIFKEASGDVSDHITIIIYVDHITFDAFLIVLNHRHNSRELFDLFDGFANHPQRTTTRDMTGHLYKDIQLCKIGFNTVVNVDLNHFLRYDGACDHRHDAVVGTNKILSFEFYRNVFVLGVLLRVDPDDVYGSIRKVFIRILNDVGSFGNVKGRDIVRDINNLCISHFTINGPFNRAGKMVF